MVKSLLFFSTAQCCAAEVAHSPSASDLWRAKTPRPLPSSAVYGETAPEAFDGMNKVLAAGPASVKACEEFDHEALNEVARTLYHSRSMELDEHYRSIEDNRALHFDDLSYKEELWKGESIATSAHRSHAPGSSKYNAIRDGKCAELIMWYTHHVPESKRNALASSSNFTMPLMPRDVAAEEHRTHEYARQITCTSCHLRLQDPTKPEFIPPAPREEGSGPQYQEFCENGVYYDRTKRCDWDYEPFCKPCEGVGGYIWGDGPNDYNPMPCEPIGGPEDIPEDQRTTVLWPKTFTVKEYADLSFPGRDPCVTDFKNSTYILMFDTTAEGGTYHSIGLSGPSGPSPLPGDSWHLPNGNFFATTKGPFGNNVFCICTSPEEPSVENAINGPLTYDFLSGAAYIGRERIVPENLNKEFVADHWVKGPHHFWFDIETDLMIREWQPFNGLNIYYDWEMTVDPEKMQVPGICTSGILKTNISCKAPPPSQLIV